MPVDSLVLNDSVFYASIFQNESRIIAYMFAKSVSMRSRIHDRRSLLVHWSFRVGIDRYRLCMDVRYRTRARQVAPDNLIVCGGAVAVAGWGAGRWYRLRSFELSPVRSFPENPTVQNFRHSRRSGGKYG
jgi:hypothetical protein